MYNKQNLRTFIDDRTFNCTLCNTNYVPYRVIEHGYFNTSPNTAHKYFLTKCTKCEGQAIHFTQYAVIYEHGYISNPPKRRFIKKQPRDVPILGGTLLTNYSPIEVVETIKDANGRELELDDLFYVSRPSRGLIFHEEIPKVVRKYLNEADEGRRQNLLTGASAALRKAIYKMLKHQNIPEVHEETDKRISYNERLDMVKQKCPHVESIYLDQLKEIQSMTSVELHENDWDEFDGKTLHFLIETTAELLWELYVIPARKEIKRQELLNLSSKIKKRNVNKNTEDT